MQARPRNQLIKEETSFSSNPPEDETLRTSSRSADLARTRGPSLAAATWLIAPSGVANDTLALLSAGDVSLLFL
jgi:hypothetical protein